MYPNILISIFILLVALEVIGGMLGSPKLAKAAGVGMVLLIAASLIIWLLLGWSPVPPWFAKGVARIIHAARSAKLPSE